MKIQARSAVLLAAMLMLLAAEAHVARAQGNQGSSATPLSLPSFEVASIKPDTSGSMLEGFQFPDPGRFRGVNLPVTDMILLAYNIKPSQLSGAPPWASSLRYSIDAKIDDVTAAALEKLPREQQLDQTRLMMQSLLADRFKLVLSRASREMPIYLLVVAKAGPRLTPTKVVQSDTGTQRAPQANGPHLMVRPGKIDAVSASMPRLAELLSHQPDLGGRIVVDKTRLTGSYDFTLQFTQTNPFPTAPMPNAAQPPTSDSSGPSIFTALEEQLGLRLESSRSPVDVYTIDRIEEPSPN